MRASHPEPASRSPRVSGEQGFAGGPAPANTRAGVPAAPRGGGPAAAPPPALPGKPLPSCRTLAGLCLQPPWAPGSPGRSLSFWSDDHQCFQGHLPGADGPHSPHPAPSLGPSVTSAPRPIPGDPGDPACPLRTLRLLCRGTLGMGKPRCGVIMGCSPETPPRLSRQPRGLRVSTDPAAGGWGPGPPPQGPERPPSPLPPSTRRALVTFCHVGNHFLLVFSFPFFPGKGRPRAVTQRSRVPRPGTPGSEGARHPGAAGALGIRCPSYVQAERGVADPRRGRTAGGERLGSLAAGVPEPRSRAGETHGAASPPRGLPEASAPGGRPPLALRRSPQHS